MLPLFTTPFAFLALLAVPALAAIYWLRSRFRRYPVSSLMLWVDQREAREGGTRVHRLQTPLLFYLELLAILLLIAAAAGPHIPLTQGTRPLVVVLDDSYSMLAGGAESPRTHAIAALEEELRTRARYSVRFILAGETPQLLSEPARTVGEAVSLLDDWKCRAATSSLDAAVGLAAELGGERALILVLTDHAPAAEPETGRIQWWAFGSPRPNLAFVNAARTARDGPERCLLEVANLSTESQTTTLVIEAGTPAVEIQRSPFALGPQETRRVIFELKEKTPALQARLGDDALDIDNQVILLPTVRQPLRAEVRVQDESLRALVEKALRAGQGAILTAVRPHLLFTDQEGDRPAGAETWLVQLILEQEAEAYVGPFVLDRAHPLTEGLALQGVVWGAGKTEKLTGTPVITAGNIPLLTDTEALSGRHELRLRLRPDLSTLPDSPNWPVLMWNLMQWRAARAPGLDRINVRLGEEVTLTVATGVETAQITSPDQRTRQVPVHARRMTARAEQVGVYEIHVAASQYAFAVNTLQRDESDLQSCVTGRWGDWLDETALRLEYQSIAWILLLLVLAILSLHLFLVARNAGRTHT
jgi:hypothetical protein